MGSADGVEVFVESAVAPKNAEYGSITQQLIGSYGWVGMGVFVIDPFSAVEVLNFAVDQAFIAGLWEGAV